MSNIGQESTIGGADPVHQFAYSWYFWDETWSDKIGPFKNEEEARNKLKEYADSL